MVHPHEDDDSGLLEYEQFCEAYMEEHLYNLHKFHDFLFINAGWYKPKTKRSQGYLAHANANDRLYTSDSITPQTFLWMITEIEAPSTKATSPSGRS